ncbi:hypothetical protein K466DRAFT_573933 [Polyporus arcularius HHB13444]|uniref:CxC5 like cysteine cluster associated with KDZ domain-containing protein n=1 Tax=Polyporus arcularius HHB13444 TaxID=1314778 RepID=A0A5C3PMQ9_9APHY|nr:hypothetical protein K466DRAFT_573933 [Polyporus arcularius HHB13444]
MYLRDLVALVSQTPHLGDILLDDIVSFLRFARLTRSNIEITLYDKTNPPVLLPRSVHEFLAAALQKSFTEVAWLWYALRGAVWTSGKVVATQEEVTAFRDHGLSRSIVCIRLECRNHRTNNDLLTLGEPISYRATLYTLHEGALPVHTTSLYCHVCHRRYHHNYFVEKEGSCRTYYGGPPPTVVQVSTHFFVESGVLELFGCAMVFGWLSANNCARLYNVALAISNPEVHNNPLAYGVTPFLPLYKSTWPYSFEMSGDTAMNGFLLYSLLLDKAEHNSHLTLPHDCPTQKDRLMEALVVRNKAMEGIGQEEWAHACDLCFKVQQKPDGTFVKVQYAVGDGLSIGRPCCAFHDCKVNLASRHDIWCPEHAYLAQKCAVVDCDANRTAQFRTCDIAEHRALELAYRKDYSRSMHQLRARLRAAGVEVPGEDDEDEVIVTGDLEDIEGAVRVEEASSMPLDDNLQCDGKASGSKSTLKARMGRRRTHNEQVVARPCGVYLSRATLFGFEAVSAVTEHLKATFPTPPSTPEIFVYDSNCRVREHLNANGDTYFAQTGLPVDVFHFKAKHRITDTACQEHCNPAAFPDLVDGDKWRINTSICEENNVWMNGYAAALREMEATRYTFFLDEMIKRRNRFTVAQLERKGHCPWRIPIETLFPDHRDVRIY